MLNDTHLTLLNDESYVQMTLAWRDLSVKVPKKCDRSPSTVTSLFKRLFSSRKNTEWLSIIDQVNGKAESGQLVAVMGSSGCGKTTLLAALSQRIKANVSGQILVNGIPPDADSLAKMCGFVPQHDVVVETLTTMEHLCFMACMKLDRRLDRGSRQRWIVSLLSELNLAGSEDTRLSALSGGERRRLSLAVEVLDGWLVNVVMSQLLTDPAILFCDEPTTGLDSFSALAVVEKLKHLSQRGKLVICSIHQPASDTFSCFTHLVLLSGGRLAYQGTIGQANSFFSSMGLVCPESYNPAEFYVQQLCLPPDSGRESLCDTFKRLNVDHQVRGGDKCGHEAFRGRYRAQWFVQMYWLIWRSTIDTKRNLRSHCTQLAVFLVTSVILTSFYWNVESNSQAGIQDCRGLLYLICAEVIYTSAYTVFNTFPTEIPLFLREKGMYSLPVYYISKIICLVPRATLEPLAYLAIIYMVRDINQAGIVTYFKMALPLVLVSHVGTAYGCMLSAAFNSPNLAATVSQPLDTLFFLMGGLYFNINTFPASLTWLKYLSMFYYSNELISVIHWSRVNEIACPANPSLPCLENGAEVLLQYGYKADNMVVDILGLMLLYVSMNLLGFVGIWKRSQKQAIY